MKKFLIAGAALVMGAAPIAASAAPFYGHEGRYERGWRRDHDGDRGAAVAAGLFGLFLGAAVANSHSYDYDRDYGYGYGYGYGEPYAVRCHWETRAYEGPWGSVNYQQVQVCR